MMSTAASTTENETDHDLDLALDEILGEAFLEAENPPANARDVGGTRGHVEGSRAFPRDLMAEEVRPFKLCTLIFFRFALLPRPIRHFYHT